MVIQITLILLMHVRHVEYRTDVESFDVIWIVLCLVMISSILCKSEVDGRDCHVVACFRSCSHLVVTKRRHEKEVIRPARHLTFRLFTIDIPLQEISLYRSGFV